jgi:hypothetical protein
MQVSPYEKYSPPRLLPFSCQEKGLGDEFRAFRTLIIVLISGRFFGTLLAGIAFELFDVKQDILRRYSS